MFQIQEKRNHKWVTVFTLTTIWSAQNKWERIMKRKPKLEMRCINNSKPLLAHYVPGTVKD